MDELGKTLLVEFIKQGPLVALLLYLHLQNRADIRAERERNQSLIDKFLTAGSDRATAQVQAMTANSAALEKFSDEVTDLRRSVDALRMKP